MGGNSGAGTGGGGGSAGTSGPGSGGAGAGGGGGGAGLFAGAGTYSFDPAIGAIRIGDLNGDGRPDIAAISGCGSSGQPGELVVLLNQGAGTFAPATKYPAGPTPAALDIGDVNGDGKADVAVLNRGLDCGGAPALTEDVTLLLNAGGGTFDAPTHVSVGKVPWNIALGDLNGDGRADLAVANHGTGTELELRDSGVSVLLATAGGGFGAPTKYAAGVGPTAVRIADLDSAGGADLIVANYGYSGIGAPEGTSSVSVLLGNAGGGFAAMNNLTAVPGCADIAFVDFDEDRDLDMVVMNYAGLQSIRNEGGGVFTAATANFAPFLDSGSVAIADFDGDNHQDVAVGGYSGAFLLGGNGNGTFRPQVTLPTSADPSGVMTADFDGDGKPDLVVLNKAGLQVLLNRR